MKEQEKIVKTEKKKKESWDHYVKMGTTAFVTVAACITFYFILYRWDTIAAYINKIVTSSESIIMGLAMAYLLMPTKKFIEKKVYRFLKKRKIKKDKAKEIAKFLSITGAIVFLFVIIGVLIAILVPALLTSVFGLH